MADRSIEDILAVIEFEKDDDQNNSQSAKIIDFISRSTDF